MKILLNNKTSTLLILPLSENNPYAITQLSEFFGNFFEIIFSSASIVYSRRRPDLMWKIIELFLGVMEYHILSNLLIDSR